jgi:antitoxin component of MazEF toxin-antitoxin module
MPYAGGWTRVTASTMEDTWTALSNDAKDSSGNAYVSEQSFGKMPELDPDTGLPVDSTEVIPNMVSYDFANVQDSDVTGGTLSVKAVYIPGDMLNSGANVGDSLYVTTGDLDYSLLSSLKGEETVFGVSLQYRRINKDGYGTTKAHIPKVRMDMTQDNAAQSTAVTVDVDNGEVIDVELSPSYNVATVDYQLVDTYDANIITGAQYSEQNEKSIKNIDGLTGGFVYAAMWPELLQDIYDITYNKTTAFLTAEELNMLQLKNATNQKEFSTTAHVTAAKTYLKKYIGFAIADGQDWHTLTYYQVQYAICGKASTAAKYKNAQEAEEYCKATYSWCQN